LHDLGCDGDDAEERLERVPLTVGDLIEAASLECW
jgi:hypothetical protein